MKFSLVICTYLRPQSLLELLHSIKAQTLYPNEIIIVDGSTNDDTGILLKEHRFKHLKYFKVDAEHIGLTKQRNFGIKKVSVDSEVICFLDDDIILKPDYFEELISTYTKEPEALAVGGYITNEVCWEQSDEANSGNYFYYDGWKRKEPSRFKLRRTFGLLPDAKPGYMPTFSHGRSVSFLPPSGKIYQVEQIMGGVSSYKKEVFKTMQFSTYFEGYGLYEDADFSLRLSKKGNLYVNTAAQLAHHHNKSGRPNKLKYGKMVIRNGWYVWRVKYPKPSIKATLKWHATAFLLTIIRSTNTLTTDSIKRQEAFTESLGRFVGWLSLIFNKPKVKA
ncbi:glycosyl transferase family 2 [Seonamhaeicola sp. S2-3]|uniref:glycosyltransferase family 2 protein n=1 Tax=Seonamhaeicola sp. S2-3 TaxID=1936081 RepID=UPI000972A517|nr:glycosyltransferase family 2 protein [Seonamhaeicola sp. S2-3]APY09992.1 glycosyl transferase family 2 [Seonamhaeicola sp. S2-3]